MPMIYQSVNDVLKEYPQRNSAWRPLDSCFVADASDLGMDVGDVPRKDIKDAWNRDFPNKWRSDVNDECDLIGWHTETSVNGQSFRFNIFND